MSIVYLLIGLTLLVIGGEYLVRAAVGLSFKLKLSKMVIGLTVVSFATSMPELIVSLQAALKGFSDISLGNIIGSNIANIGLVLGVTAIISPIVIDRDFYKYNWPVMMLFSIGLYFFLANDNVLSLTEGIGFIIAMVLYLFFLIKQSKSKSRVEVDEVVAGDQLKGISYIKIIIWLIIGGVALWGGSELLVKGAVDLATAMGVSERVIAVTMIAVGTSVPELAASVIAALKKEKAISFGNLIGSNVFNIGSVLGITAIIHPITVQSQEVLTNDIFWMLGFALVLIPLAFLPKKLIFNRAKGLFIFASYLLFIGLALFN
ncbi:calcium/sodium antiporter [Planktosalinus lacus]|uniref:Sodium:calcium antiporter n=1 Tax=Planktosalinus lacus TaxID=1526573 RepID=A0A8J2V9V1_9FLAO|nr:calcium/sodium antiporter [Planktosalinus lacus]GGD91696.1 sodium:calcium antiporter [Planktosalinus lacus]